MAVAAALGILAGAGTADAAPGEMMSGSQDGTPVAAPIAFDPSSGRQAGSEAIPADFGFALPSPEPPLPAGTDAFEPPLVPTSATGPLIAESSKTAGPDDIVAMAGVKLDGATRFAVFSQAATAETGEMRDIGSLAADATAATVLLPASLPSWSMYLVWPNRGGTYGRPIAINRTEAWWLGPDNAAPGATISVFGRNLARSNGTKTSFLYIKPPNAIGQYVRPVSVNPFKVDFKVPELAAGSYEVWVHNGHGGRFGWSGPLVLHVLAQSPWAAQEDHVVEAKDFGAVGDGVTDDTAGLKAALKAAADAAPATLHLAAGNYRVTAPLEAPDDVRWRGDGMDRTRIFLDAATGTSMIEGARRNVQFQDLTLDANRMTGAKPLLDIPSARNLRIDSVRLRAWGTQALQANDARGLYITSSELIENGSFYGASRQVFMTGNRFRMTGYGESVVALWGGSDFAMVGNDLANADESRDDGHGIGRFFVAQAHWGSMRNMYWGGNVSHDAAPHDCDKVDCNKGEQICFEMVGSTLIGGFESATATTVSFRSLAPPSETSGKDLIIVGGRGAGQHRHVVSVENGTVGLEKPWKVIPDETSRFALAGAASRAVIYDNTFEGRGSYAEHDSDSTAVLLYGSVYDMVVDHNRISQMRHGMMTVALDSTEGLSPYFLRYSNNIVTDSNSGLYVGTTFTESGIAGIWGGLGNIYRDNTFKHLAHIGVEYESWAYEGADYNATVFEGNRFEDLPFGFIDAYHLMWTYKRPFKAPPELSSRKVNTVLYKNSFDRGRAPYAESVGFKSMEPRNTWLDIGSTWTGFASGNKGPPSNASR